MIDDDLRARRLAILEEHFASEVDQEFERTLATFAGRPHYEIMATGQVFDGDRITNERIYLDTASMLGQIGRAGVLANASAD